MSTGINLVVYYMPTVLITNVGLTRNTALLIAGGVNCMFVVGESRGSSLLDQS